MNTRRYRGGLRPAAEILAGSKPMYLPDPSRLQWGLWRLDPQNHTLTHAVHPSCQIDLDRINTCGEMLDWLFHVSTKRWTTGDDRANLVDALRTIFDAQVRFCPGGETREIDAQKYLTEKYSHGTHTPHTRARLMEGPKHSLLGQEYEFNLYNFETECIEAAERLTCGEAALRNYKLREGNEPVRWIGALEKEGA